MTESAGTPGIKRIAVIGDYLPRQCGIATFTTDLCEALSAQFPDTQVFAAPVNDTDEGYDYPSRVRFEIAQDDLSSYRRAADFLNINNVDVVCVQHEYGIYGGRAGSHILALLSELRMPVVTTLHTILETPDPNQKKVMEELTRLSDRLVVMSRRGLKFLEEVYHVPSNRIQMIHHGTPDVPFVDPSFHKDRFGVEGKIVLLTFGLLSPSKGIEYVIEALPAILEQYPNLVFVVVGATHPNVRKENGELYRLQLERLAKDLGVDRSVVFHNRFVDIEELVEFIGAADLYVTPYLNREQICSGTLAYTVAAGKPVISTPYWYAEELLAEGRGILVPFRDSQAIAGRVIELLATEADRHAIRKRAYLFGREMVWPKVAAGYMQAFEEVRDHRRRRPKPFSVRTLGQSPAELPPLSLEHLNRLTDETGLFQHAIHTIPNYREGYTTDDNTRGLILTVLLEDLGEEEEVQQTEDLPARYLAFVFYAYNSENGRFRNFLGFDRHWSEEKGSDDSHGRALWALGSVSGRSRDPERAALAGQLFNTALKAMKDCTSPRSWAFTLLGLHDYLKRYAGDRDARQMQEMLAERLMEMFAHNASEDWAWFEDILTYSNATLAQALIVSGRAMARPAYIETGLRALSWLGSIQGINDGHFVPIGSIGFYRRGGERARFDQQPIEAQAMVSACLDAYRITGDKKWRKDAQLTFEWFLGRNDLRLPLYDPSTGGCRDGLHSDRVNQNQGAESTLAFLMALLELRLAEQVLEI
ncbi:MAG: glycosyltransferase family 4 protein [Pseudomonadota bacterium]